MGHVTNILGGMRIDAKVADQAGPVWQVLPVGRQRAALKFLADQAFDTPEWIVPTAVISRIGPTASGISALASRQANIVTALTQPARLDRMTQSAALQPGVGYDIPMFLGELTMSVLGGASPDVNRRTLHRVYLERMQALIDPPAPAAAGGQGGGGGFGAGQPQVNVRRSDISASARAQVRTVAALARTRAGTSTGANRAHWLDIADRAQAILDPRG
jgi:hypothetical protein